MDQIPPLPPGLEPAPDAPAQGPLKPLDPWPGEPLDLHSEFLRFAADLRGLADPAESVRRTLALCRLEEVAAQGIDTLSKGYRMRVGFAQAVLHDPEVLILDEPTDGLDPNQKHEVRELIRELGGDRAVVLSTHILEEVEAVCTRAVVINRGAIVFDGTPAEMESRAPAGTARNRMDAAFRAMTTGDAPAAQAGAAAGSKKEKGARR